eukprot:scaffold26432_cov33-Tisochrysis_lutea.AAC.3
MGPAAWLLRTCPPNKLLERLNHIGTPDTEQLDVSAAHVLAVLRHGALPVLRTAKLNIGFACRLLVLIVHQVHPVERHAETGEELEDVIAIHPVWQPAHLDDRLHARGPHARSANGPSVHVLRRDCGERTIGIRNAIAARHAARHASLHLDGREVVRLVCARQRLVHLQGQMCRVAAHYSKAWRHPHAAPSTRAEAHLLWSRAEHLHVTLSDGCPILGERRISNLFRGELNECLAIGPAVVAQHEVDAHHAVWYVVAVEELQNRVRGDVEGKAAQSDDALSMRGRPDSV